MTWYQLINRMNKQPLNLTRNKKVAVKIQNKMYECKVVYTYNGSDWHLEPIKEIKEEEKKKERKTNTQDIHPTYNNNIPKLSIEEENELIEEYMGATREELQKLVGYTDEQIEYVIIAAYWRRKFIEFEKERRK